MPGIIVPKFGKGKVVYLAAALDAALWSYAYPYQRRLLGQAVRLAAREPAPLRIEAPTCVQVACCAQEDDEGRRLAIHLFNGLNTTANHGLPETDVPLREETPPIHGIRVRFRAGDFKQFHLEPEGADLAAQREGQAATVELPPLVIHAMLVAEVA